VFGIRLALTILVICTPTAALAATADVAKADAARKKPLQRCDQLTDQAQLDCLNKARERIVEARQKRENDAKSEGAVSTKK